MADGLRDLLRCACLLVVTLAWLAGCGGGHSDKKANEAYASSVCTAIGNWGTDVTSIATDFSGGISKASLQSKLQQFETATKNLVSQIKAVPPPNTSDGQAAKTQIDQFVGQVQTTTASVKSASAQIPANATVTQTATALAALAPQLKALRSSAQSTVKELKSAGGSLASAFGSEQACKRVGD